MKNKLDVRAEQVTNDLATIFEKNGSSRKEKGITLIALVITIIVLLILAGVSLNLVAGSNGILRRATNAVTISNERAIEERVQLALAEMQMDYYAGGAHEPSFADYLKAHDMYTMATGEVLTFEVNDDGTVDIAYFSNASKTEADMNLSFDLATNEITVEATGGQAKPDTTAPVIQVTGATTSSLTFKITDKGGVAGYKVTETETEPTDSEWELLGNQKVYEGLTQTGLNANQTYYIWAKDKLGNVHHISHKTKMIMSTVTYDANGGTGTVPNTQTVAYKNVVTVDTTTIPTREGYKFLGWARTNNATETISSFEMPAENVTLYAVWEELATHTIKPENYGDTANYSANDVEDWQVFLNDGSNIYLIASDYVPVSGMTLESGISIGSWNETYCINASSGDDLLSWLVNPSNWSQYATGFPDATVYGGPTLSQFVKSYNQKMGTNYSDDVGQDNQFISNIVDVLYNPHPENAWNNVFGYWLASMSSRGTDYIWRVICASNDIYYWGCSDGATAIRPLVKLPAEVKAEFSNGMWKFSN